MMDETLLPEALRPGTRLLVEQFASALASKGLSLPEQHLGDRVTVQEFRRQFTTAFAASEYIAKTCIVCPELLLDLVQSGELFAPLGARAYATLAEDVADCENEDEMEACLRRHSQRAMERIVMRYLNSLSKMCNTIAEQC